VRDHCNGAKEKGLEDARIIILGERGRGGLERLFKQHFVLSVTDYEKVRNFRQCAELADYFLANTADKTSIFYQKFNSMISYSTLEYVNWNFESMKDEVGNNFAEYEMEGDADILQNLYEFKSAVKMFHFFAELDTSTLSARMQAMDSASTNAGELIDALTLKLNRTRQAKITTELSEIISGAAAADDAA
jgi:ATP synthase F1 gamma subunit